MTDYNPELLPLSIGMGKHARLVARDGELPIESRVVCDQHDGLHVALRGRGSIVRNFFTDGEFVMSDEVDMPNVLDNHGEGRLHEAWADDRRLVHEAANAGRR